MPEEAGTFLNQHWRPCAYDGGGTDETMNKHAAQTTNRQFSLFGSIRARDVGRSIVKMKRLSRLVPEWALDSSYEARGCSYLANYGMGLSRYYS
jgi:hypothetical protein